MAQQILAANELVRPSLPIASNATQNNEELLSLAEESLAAEGMVFDSVIVSEVSEADVSIGASNSQLRTVAPSAASQPTIAFEQLKERSRQVASKNNYARVEDITLQQNFQQKSEQLKRKKSDSQKTEAQRLQKTAKKQIASEKIVLAEPNSSQRINTFSSEIDQEEID